MFPVFKTWMNFMSYHGSALCESQQSDRPALMGRTACFYTLHRCEAVYYPFSDHKWNTQTHIRYCLRWCKVFVILGEMYWIKSSFSLNFFVSKWGRKEEKLKYGSYSSCNVIFYTAVICNGMFSWCQWLCWSDSSYLGKWWLWSWSLSSVKLHSNITNGHCDNCSTLKEVHSGLLKIYDQVYGFSHFLV